MAATLVQQMPVSVEGTASADAYLLHSWRPWMSLYGLRLKSRASGQQDVRLQQSQLLLLQAAQVFAFPLHLWTCKKLTLRSIAGPTGTYTKAVTSRDHHYSAEVSSCGNTVLLSVCLQTVEFPGFLSSTLEACLS